MFVRNLNEGNLIEEVEPEVMLYSVYLLAVDPAGELIAV
jgi:hypothetical protein